MKHRLLLLLIGLFVIAGNKAVADDVYFTVDEVDVMQGKSAKVTMYYDADGSKEYKGFQIEFVLPDGLHLTDAVLGPEIIANNPEMTIRFIDRRESDKISVIKASQIALTPMPMGEGIELCSFFITADDDCEIGEYTVPTWKIELAAENKVAFGPQMITYNVIPYSRRLLLDTATDLPVSSSAPEDVIVKRTIKADTWSTLTLPFDLSDDQVADIFGNNVKVAEYQGYSINEKQQYVMKFETVDALSQGLDNNTPYLIKTDKSLDEFSVDEVMVDADEDNAIVERDNKSSVIGTLRAGKIPANCLFLRDNNFFVSKGDSKINAFRAYFKIDGYEYKTTDSNISFMIDGEETSIEGIIVNGNEIVSGDVYSVNGTFMGRAENVMNDLPKGVYIVNNKKVVVK